MDSEVLDYGLVPEIYADGIADVVFVDMNCRITSFAWRKVGGVLRRVAVVDIIRPTQSLLPSVIAVWRQKFSVAHSPELH